jgi:hypothetical protein
MLHRRPAVAASLVAAVFLLGLGCAETTPSPPPPVPTLVVLDSTHGALQIIPVEAPNGATTMPLNPGSSTLVGLATRNELAVITEASPSTVLIVDLSQRSILHTLIMPALSRAGGPTILDDTTAYVALPGLGQLMRIDVRTGDTASVTVGESPGAAIATRGKVFALNTAQLICGVDPCPSGPSWLTVVDPVLNHRAEDIDSIPLVGPGNALYGTVGSDGQLYIVQAGTPDQGEGRLSIVDPVSRVEKASFGGFGISPGPVAADQGDRIIIASESEGMMLFDLRLREVERGSGEGLPVAGNSAVAADDRNFLFGVASQPCGGTTGRIRIFRPDLTEVAGLDAGSCPAAAAVTGLPSH